jgi:hypothetical protein
MDPVTRRSFLKRAGLGAAAVGVAATVPSFMRDRAKPSQMTPAVPMGRVSQSGPVVAHISDANTGDITLMSGTKEVTYHNAALARELLRAAQ